MKPQWRLVGGEGVLEAEPILGVVCPQEVWF